MSVVAVHTGASTRDAHLPTDTRSTCCRTLWTPGSNAAGQAHCHAAGGSRHYQRGRLFAVSTQPHQLTRTTSVWLTLVETRGSVRRPLDVLMTPWRTNTYSIITAVKLMH